MHEKADGQRDVDRFHVELVGRFFVEFNKVRSFWICLVTDCSPFVKLEKCCRVDLSQLTLGRSQSPFDSEGWRFCR